MKITYSLKYFHIKASLHLFSEDADIESFSSDVSEDDLAGISLLGESNEEDITEANVTIDENLDERTVCGSLPKPKFMVCFSVWSVAYTFIWIIFSKMTAALWNII